jgi:hypothetical protein
MAGNAHVYSTAVNPPNEGLAPTTSPTAHPADHKDPAAVMQGVTEVPAGERVEEEEMPEGPTTGKYEEWAYVSAHWVLHSPGSVVESKADVATAITDTRSTCITTATLELAQMATRPPSSR